MFKSENIGADIVADSEKICIGISFGFNASACVVSSERGVLAAISQERMDSIKNTKAIPFDAMIACIKQSGIDRVDMIAYSHYEELTEEHIGKYIGADYQDAWANAESIESLFTNIIASCGFSVVGNIPMKRVEHHTAHAWAPYAFYGIPTDEHIQITSDGFGDGLSAQISQVDIVRNGGRKTLHAQRISSVPMCGSVGLIYQFTTGALGFKEHQHEGKVTGLAAFGDVSRTVDNFYDLFRMTSDKSYSGNGMEFDQRDIGLTNEEIEMVKKSAIIDFDVFLRMKKKTYEMVSGLLASGVSKTHIAAGVQRFAENVTTSWIADCIPNVPESMKVDCYLSGGLFANVKINQKIKETGLFKNVYVCPPMGDEGTCVGAAYYVVENDMGGFAIANVSCGTKCVPLVNCFVYQNKSIDRTELDFNSVCSGTEVECLSVDDVSSYIAGTGKEILLQGQSCKQVFNKMHVHGSGGFIFTCGSDVYAVAQYDKQEQVSSVIANCLSNNKIVCLVNGRMEFGPRALCHRSILYNCDSKSTNSWLNEQLGRTEFMPFAPCCKEENADDLFEHMDGGRGSAKYMTMTFRGTSEFIGKYPAAVHVDGTARPQLVSKKSNQFMWDILDKYERMTSKKALINTSFNLHNNPIIENPYVAIESWLKSRTDILVINNIVLMRCV